MSGGAITYDPPTDLHAFHICYCQCKFFTTIIFLTISLDIYPKASKFFAMWALDMIWSEQKPFGSPEQYNQ